MFDPIHFHYIDCTKRHIGAASIDVNCELAGSDSALPVVKQDAEFTLVAEAVKRGQLRHKRAHTLEDQTSLISTYIYQHRRA